MKRLTLICCFAASVSLWSSASAETVGAEIVSGPAAASKLELRDLEVRSDGSVTGTVVNESGGVIKDVELLVSHTWSWRDERHPGDDNPGRTSHVPVTGEIPANGSVTFAYTPDPALPMRPDGSFRTTAAVQSFTELED